MSWGPYHDACVDCGETGRPHRGRGLCRRCYQRRHRAGTLAEVSRPWSAEAESCVACGEKDRPHCARGLCRRCYSKRYLRSYRSSPRGRVAIQQSRRRYLADSRNAELNRQAARRGRERAYGPNFHLDIPIGYEALVFEMFGCRCAACGTDDDLVLDHHHSLQDGHALLHNAVLLCRGCNARKSNKPPHEFYDRWKLTEIAVLLWETRNEYERRFREAA